MKKICLTLAIILTMSGLAITRAAATPDTVVVAANCSAIQSVLTRLEKTDVSTRLNRGSDYDKLLKLMFAMNTRLSANRIAAPDLISITAEFEQATKDFRTNYDTYSDKLGEAISLNCNDDPMKFYVILGETRGARATLHDDVSKLRQLTDDYWAAFDKVTETLL